MSNRKDNVETPKNTRQQSRRLGLRRISSTTPFNHKDQSVQKETRTAGSKNNGALCRNPSTTTPLAIQSDLRVNYRCLEQHGSSTRELSTPATTKTSTPLMAASTSCRPYRLALNKRMREKLTKKRLQFHLANDGDEEMASKFSCKDGTPDHVKTTDSKMDIKTADIECSGGADGDVIENLTHSKLEDIPAENISKHLISNKEKNNEGAGSWHKEAEDRLRAELIVDIKKARAELEAQQQHERKVQELKDAIATWQNGFSAALYDLQQQTDPRMELSELLRRLGIPQEMLQYVKD